MSEQYYLNNTSIARKIDKLIKTHEKRLLADRMSSRMVKCGSVLETNEHIEELRGQQAKYDCFF